MTLVLPLLSGCFSVVLSDEPLGELVPLKPEAWDGFWVAKRSVSLVRVVDADRGVISLIHKACEAPRSESQRDGFLFELRQSRDAKWFFPTMVEREPSGNFGPRGGATSYGYFFLIFRPDSDTWISYRPSEPTIMSLIENGALPGRVGDDKVVLGHLEPEDYKVLLSEEHPTLQWRKPDVFARVPPELGLDQCRTRRSDRERTDRTYLVVDADDLTPVWGARLQLEPCDAKCQETPMETYVFPDQPRGDRASTNRGGKVTLNLPVGPDHWIRSLTAPDRESTIDPKRRLSRRPEGVDEVLYMCRGPC
ncbi:MAG: hypothetical protein P8Y76_09845 [bacterium]